VLEDLPAGIKYVGVENGPLDNPEDEVRVGKFVVTVSIV